MQKSFYKSALSALLAVWFVTFCPRLAAQITTSGISGLVRDTDGKPVAGATVTAVYAPTNASFTAVASNLGRFNFRGLPVGGPFTLSAKAPGFAGEATNDIFTELGTDIDVNLTIKSDVVVMEKFVATASRTELDAGATGSGITLSPERLSNKPTSERSLADMISASPLVTLRETFGDREESSISAVGQNQRYNSIQIDGARINDLFGLNSTGLASFFNPLSLDTIEQLAVQVSPYDVRQSNFTGASINAVTKSGTNKFHGSVYGYWRGDHMFGFQMQGYNPREQAVSGTRFNPRLERHTYGATLGGPIIPNRLFFFANYEDFQSTSAGRDARFSTPSEQQILQKLQADAQAAGDKIDWGSPVTGQTANTSKDKKYLYKVDWNITADQHLTVRYSKTKGEVPQFGNFANSSVSLNGVTGGITTSPTGHFYSQTRKEESWAGQLVSQWSPSLNTEIKYATTKQDQLTPLNSIAPMVLITGVSGTDLLNGTSVTNGAYVAGTEQFRHGNVILVDSKQMGATANYTWKNFVFTGGFEREQTDYYNLFRNGSYGLVAFRSMADFLADTNAVIQRNVYDPKVRNVADVSNMATNGVFAQAKWDAGSRLSLTAGLRYEFVESATPPFNRALLNDTGFRNDGNLDGTNAISPRLGFNLALDDERRTQVRGGIGHFFGRAPWVIFSNSWNAPGVGSFTLLSSAGQLPTSLTDYLKNNFDPASPIGTGTDNPTLRREVDWVDNKTGLPQSWRGNLAVEHRLDIFNSTISVEINHDEVDKALFVTNENLKPTSVGLDGRQRFAGNPSTAANARFAGYTNLIRVRNTGVGKSTYATVQWSRPLRDKWGFDVSYTRGHATEAQSVGQTTAGGQWFRNVVFNQNTVEEGIADYEIKDRVQVNLIRQFEFVKRYRTTASLYYEGKSGNPYSWVFSGDLNGDSVSFNDTVFVPTGPSDPRFDFSGMTAAQVTSFFDFIRTSGLGAYAGGIAPKNAFREPWVNRLDLKFTQEIPIAGPARLQLFLDFINFGAFLSRKTFGYVELSPNYVNGVYRTRTLTTGTSYAADGRIRPLFANPPTGFNIDNGMSRWRIQLGAKVSF